MNPEPKPPAAPRVSEQWLHRKVRSFSDGYGHRFKTIHLPCGSVVTDLDPGNAPGAAMASKLLRDAMASHICNVPLEAPNAAE